VDLDGAIQQIDTLIARRASERTKANAVADRQRREDEAKLARRRRRLQAQWYAYHLRLAENHAALASEHEGRALELLES
jgi:ribonuclease HI